jgi:2'-5' RNA ligase
MTMSSILPTRRQASFYLSDVPEIEDLRIRFNPVQAQFIPAHVTLCREDEVDDWSVLESRIQARIPIALTLGFRCPVREGNLVFLPAVSGVGEFDDLRNQLLSDGIKRPRKQTPHITIIHSRNGSCTDAVFDEIGQRLHPFTITLREISLIEQTGGGPWVRLAHFGTGMHKL